MNLNEAQSLFKKNVLSGESDPQALQEFKPAGKLSLEQAFEIFNRSYLARLTKVLKETFGGVYWVTGEDLFQTLCHKYIQSQPSVTYALSDYGHSFPEFLQVTDSAKGIPFLFDLARFEWIFKKMYHAPTPEPLPAERIQELLHSEDFRVQFIEAMEIFESPYAIYDIWRLRKEPSYRFEDINWKHAESLIIYKKQKKIFVQRIDAIEAQILSELKEGSSVSSALADYSSLLTPDQIAQLFQMMIKTGIVEDVLIIDV